MRNHFWGGLIVLLALLGAEVAHAQNVVVLEFSGDKKGKIRGQVERALKAGKKVDVIPLGRYKAAAAKARLKGARAMTPQAVAKVSEALELDAAVEGAVGDTFFVRILDADGKELWSKDLPMRKGLISAPNAFRLARAIVTAAKMGAGGGKGGKASDEEEEQATEETGGEEEEGGEEEAPPPVAKKAPPPPPEEAAPVEPPTEERFSDSSSSKSTSTEERDRRDQEAYAESHTVTEATADPDLEVEEPRKRPRVGPRLILFRLGAVSTWRSYCSRPGVLSCKDYDALPEDQKFRDTVDFTSKLPYFGFGGSVELFPMSSFTNLLKGLGVSLGYSRGFSLTEIQSNTPDAPREVIASDESYFAQVLARYYFGVGEKRPLTGYAGIRFGIDARNFDVDAAANTPLPGSHRRYLVAGVDAAFPFLPWLRAEASGALFLSPGAGPEEVAGYGTSVKGSGFNVEVGVAGDIAGPFGYSVRFKLAQYKDEFSGVGTKWTQTTQGVAQESYTSVFANVTAQF